MFRSSAFAAAAVSASGILSASAVLSAGASVASAAVFASSVAAYQPGDGAGAFTDSAAALGAPAPLTGDTSGFPNILSPFSPPFEADETVGIGLGGFLQLNFAVPVANVPGPDFGVFTNVGLVDANYPAGVNTNPAGTFNPLLRSAEVLVSGDGASFTSLGRVDFVNPTNYFADASNPYLTAPPPGGTVANFGKPFTGNLATFDGLDWSQTLAALDGSGGGTWIDFGASGLGAIRAIRFSIGATALPGSDGKLFVDAVAANNAAVPEPATGLAIALAGGILLVRRRR